MGVGAISGDGSQMAKNVQVNLRSMLGENLELSAFTGSAKRPDVSGGDARHARMSGTPPNRTMILDEGRNLIRLLIANW